MDTGSTRTGAGLGGLVRVGDGALEPRIRAGDWVMVDQERCPDLGDTVVAVVDEQVVVRNICRWAGLEVLSGTVLKSLPVPIDDRVKLVGVVVAVMQSVACGPQVA